MAAEELENRVHHEKSETSLISEGSLELALHPPHRKTQIRPPQGIFSRRPLPPLWMVTCSPTMSMYLQTVEHSLICPRGGFQSIRHNELRDITAGFLTEVCHNVGIEPPLQPLSGEQLTFRTANREDGARLDVVAKDFWGRDRSREFFDIRVFSPFATETLPSNNATERMNKKKRENMMNVSTDRYLHWCFQPQVEWDQPPKSCTSELLQ